MKKIVILIIGVALGSSSYAAKFSGSTALGTNNSTNSVSNKTGVFDCSPSTSQIDLDINNVRARLLAGGDFWWDGVEAGQYEYPKVDPTSGEVSINALYSGALWFTGRDDGGNLQVAGQTYRGAGRHDFYTGPLSGALGTASFSVCNAYDKHFEVYFKDINSLRELFADGGTVSIGESELLALKDGSDDRSNPVQLLEWPGKGNPYYFGTDMFYDEGSLAPFYDYDGDGVYNPLRGDFPVIGGNCDAEQIAYADQMIFWVINDNGNVHGRTGGVPIGVQVNCLAFAYSTADALNDMTFYSYEIIKKTPDPLLETYMGVFVDPDLGDFQDDFIGCDTSRAMAFVYNSEATDGQYGTNPPIVAIDYFEGPIGDNGNQLGLSSFIYFNNGASGPQTDPSVAAEFRTFQAGRPSNEDGFPVWKDLSPITFGGNGYGGAGAPTKYVYPGNPINPAPAWSEVSANLNGDDRRFVQNSGPFTLLPGASQRITIGVMAVPTSNYDAKPDIEAIVGPADDLAQNLFDNCFDIVDGPDAPNLNIRELSNELVINLVNTASSNNFGEKYAEPHALPNNGVASNDSLYRFQGYMVFQLLDSKVTAQDLTNESKAKLVFQSDIKDGVSAIYNYDANGAGSYNATLKVTGNDAGALKTFVVTDDAFATGNNALINNKTYYFAAITYAYAAYTPFPVSPSLPSLEIFKQGRNNFKIYSAIPHKIDSRNGGTILQAQTGDPLTVYRYEGEGNGGVAIKLSEATENAIVASAVGFEDILEYEPGYDPLLAKVVDPLKLQNANFELRFEAYDFVFDTVIAGDSLFNAVPATTFSDSNYWKLIVTDEAGALLEVIEADRDFDRQYEQIFVDYGISVNVGIPIASSSNLRNNAPTYSVISSTITFDDPTKPWLNFIQDEGFQTPTNWIRSGSGLDPDNLGIYDSHQYDEYPSANPISSQFYDPIDAAGIDFFGKSILDGKIAPYCLASNFGNPNVTVVENRPETLYGPAFRWHIWDIPNTASSIVRNPVNTLDQLSSVSIVLTSDNSQWSECVVFETGEFLNANENSAPKGALRDNDILAPGVAFAGKGFFPGYAINLETGERLNIAFGESSSMSAYNGKDMIWNPSSDIQDVSTIIPGLDGVRVPIWGGRHFVYVFNTVYDAGNAAYDSLTNNTINTAQNQLVPSAIADVYESIMYTFIPIVEAEYEFSNPASIPTTARIDINVNRPFGSFETAETFTPEGNTTLPRYRFSTVGMAPLENQTDLAESALDDIRVVPNPYYAFSAYEESQIDNVVKIIGLPDRCEVSIFALDGKLVRKFNRAVGSSSSTVAGRQELADGQEVNSGINLDNSLSWDLNNSQRIPVGSGTYIIHINAFELGEKVVKAAIFMRPTDVSNF
ncbi:MAG: hypothetical protein H6579_07605 [Chitinophagales bacterium]|nr:hypothetical protein [Chitinophagales bacterium]